MTPRGPSGLRRERSGHSRAARAASGPRPALSLVHSDPGPDPASSGSQPGTPPRGRLGASSGEDRRTGPAVVVRAFGPVEVHLYPGAEGVDAFGVMVVTRGVGRHLTEVGRAEVARAARRPGNGRREAAARALAWASDHGFVPAPGSRPLHEPAAGTRAAGPEEQYDVYLLVPYGC